jgi:hypothetical protein
VKSLRSGKTLSYDVESRTRVADLAGTTPLSEMVQMTGDSRQWKSERESAVLAAGLLSG